MPSASVCQLIQSFFDYYSVNLGEEAVQLAEVSPRPDLPFNDSMWTKDTKSQYDTLAILTPVYPCTNSSHNVYQSSLSHIKSQLQFGASCFHQILKGNEVCVPSLVHRRRCCPCSSPFRSSPLTTCTFALRCERRITSSSCSGRDGWRASSCRRGM